MMKRCVFFLALTVFLLESCAAVDDDEVMFLIPKSAKSCLKASIRSPYRMSADNVELLRTITNPDGSPGFSKVLKFPGCFELNTVFEVLDKVPAEQVVMYHEFKWLQAFSKDVEKLDIKCSGSDTMGCGGTGNRCYYCDVCKTIKKQNDDLAQHERFEQECPTEAGRVYDYHEERCVDGWGSLDKDNDGKPDFMDDEKYEEYKKFLKDLKVEGFGTMELTVKLGLKQDGGVMKGEKLKLRKELVSIVKKHGVTGNGRIKIIEARRRYHAKVIELSQIACVNLYFDMCKNEPIEDADRVSLLKCVT